MTLNCCVASCNLRNPEERTGFVTVEFMSGTAPWPRKGDLIRLRSTPPDDECREIARRWANNPVHAIRGADKELVERNPIAEATLWHLLRQWSRAEGELAKLSEADRERAAARSDWTKKAIERRVLGTERFNGKAISAYWIGVLGISTVRSRDPRSAVAARMLADDVAQLRRAERSLLAIVKSHGIQVHLVDGVYVEVVEEPAPLGLFDAFDLRAAS